MKALIFLGSLSVGELLHLPLLFTAGFMPTSDKSVARHPGIAHVQNGKSGPSRRAGSLSPTLRTPRFCVDQGVPLAHYPSCG